MVALLGLPTLQACNSSVLQALASSSLGEGEATGRANAYR